MTGSFTHLLEENERLVAKSFFELSGLMCWSGGVCLNNPSFFLLFASVFCGLAQGPCRGLLTSVLVDNLRLRLVVTYACLSSKLRCYIVTLLHCYVFVFAYSWKLAKKGWEKQLRSRKQGHPRAKTLSVKR